MTTRALCIVDLQLDPLRGEPRLQQLARDVATFARTRRDDYALVVASRFRNERRSTYDRLVGDDLRDPDDVALHPEIEDVADAVAESATYSSLTPRVQQLLVGAGVREVHVVGIDTDQCVLATVFALFDAGYEPVVFDDLVDSASGETCHDAGLVALRRAIGEDRVRHS
ncbi:MAG: isochorismatase [Thermoleophilia bacterium]|nr:isochorismatase [Thermoleophilia bacterium]